MESVDLYLCAVQPALKGMNEVRTHVFPWIFALVPLMNSVVFVLNSFRALCPYLFFFCLSLNYIVSSLRHNTAFQLLYS